MRIFLFILLFDIIFRSFTVIIPWEEWREELHMRALPYRLPTAAEARELSAAGELRPRLNESRESFREFWLPWPQGETRDHVSDASSKGKFAFVWLSSRLDLVEELIGFNQEWPMFSPNVSQEKRVTRARLTYADGQQRIIRSLSDPENLTHYWRWNQEKILDHETKARNDENYEEECFGYCNLLAHRYATNSAGSPLVSIRLYRVKYEFAQPSSGRKVHELPMLHVKLQLPKSYFESPDYEAHYREQMRRTAERWPAEDNPKRPGEEDRQVYADFYEFTAATGKGRFLDD
jgi:hypothetical protein